MSRPDYKDCISKYRDTLLTQKWFLEKQSEAWTAAENFVGHHFTNNIFILGLFLLGGLSAYLLIKGTQLQQSGATFWGGVLLVLVFLAIAVSYYLVSLLKKQISVSIYFAYRIDEITRSAYLEKISAYESTHLDELRSLTRSINQYVADLDLCDPNDIEQTKKLISTLSEFTEELKSLQNTLADLHSLHNNYSRGSCFDLDIHNAIIEFHK